MRLNTSEATPELSVWKDFKVMKTKVLKQIN